MGTPENVIGCLDGFLPNPEEFRAELLAKPFEDIQWKDGETYRRIQVRPDGEFNSKFEELFHQSLVPRYSMARLNYSGELPNNSIHSDGDFAEFAAVLYLSKPEDCQGGTAFWKHKKYGFRKCPTEQDIRKIGKSPKRVWDEVSSSWNKQEAWEMDRLVGMKFNRVVVYPTSLFHSRFPFEAFGNSPENGRLIWVSFFSHE